MGLHRKLSHFWEALPLAELEHIALENSLHDCPAAEAPLFTWALPSIISHKRTSLKPPEGRVRLASSVADPTRATPDAHTLSRFRSAAPDPALSEHNDCQQRVIVTLQSEVMAALYEPGSADGPQDLEPPPRESTSATDADADSGGDGDAACLTVAAAPAISALTARRCRVRGGRTGRTP